MIPFTKACGLGNDFVMICHDDVQLIQSLSAQMADRRYGIGCDQVVLVNSDETFIRFFNADGSEAEACGNGSRCAAEWLMKKSKKDEICLASLAGPLKCKRLAENTIQVSMPTPYIAGEINVNLPGVFEGLPIAVQVGNPHLVCFTDQPDEIGTFGEQLENHVAFPDRTNVEFAKIISPDHIYVRVWERGTGLTLACGSGACATVVAARSKGLVNDTVRVTQQGGDLTISIDPVTGAVSQSGHVKIVFDGTYPL
jgi:diaminopimelate epimerase